jgi:hypothetical protein
MSPDSVYYQTSSDLVIKAESASVERVRRRAQDFVLKHDCAGLGNYLQQQHVGAPGAEKAIVVINDALARCSKAQTESVARAPAGRGTGSSAIADGSGSAQPPTPPVETTKPRCETMIVADVMAQAQNQYSNGFASAALSLMVRGLRCKQVPRMYQLAALYACAARDLGSAQFYYGKLTLAQQPPIEQRCQQEGMDIRAATPAAAPKASSAAPKLKQDKSKEQPWNDDSPFMPVATPKR